MTEAPDDVDPDRLKDCLKALSPEEREVIIREVMTEEVYPVVNWAPNPLAVKATFNFIAARESVTYEELRQHLVDLNYVETEEGKYNFGIVTVEDDDPIFDTTGGRDPDTEISLTSIGEDIASVFDERDELAPHERALLCGLQPFGSGFAYLALLDEHRDEGIFRQDLEDAMVERFGGSGGYYTGYFTSWYSKLGLLEKKQVGRRKKFEPTFPETW